MAGLGVQPVDGRLDAMRLDGDPDAVVLFGQDRGFGPGVLDGDPRNYGATVIVIPNVFLKRTPPVQFVRRP